MSFLQKEEIAREFDLPERKSKIASILKQDGQAYCICRSSDCSRFMMLVQNYPNSLPSYNFHLFLSVAVMAAKSGIMGIALIFRRKKQNTSNTTTVKSARRRTRRFRQYSERFQPPQQQLLRAASRPKRRKRRLRAVQRIVAEIAKAATHPTAGHVKDALRGK